MDTEIRVSTESRPWRRIFSRRSSRDSNPRPFNHESGALTTKLSPPPPPFQATLTFFFKNVEHYNEMSPTDTSCGNSPHPHPPPPPLMLQA